MSNKLIQAKIDEMWGAWQEKQSVYTVAKKCGIAHQTVARYRELDKWDERLAKIQQKAIVVADDAVAKRRARQMKLVNAAVKSYAAQLIGELVVECPHCNQQHVITVPALKAKFSDIDNLIRLEEFVSGEADRREKRVIEVIHREPERSD